MAGDRQTLIIDAQILATKKLDAYHKQIEKAGGKAMLKLQKETKKAERNMRALGITAEKSKPMFGRFAQGITKGIIVARAFEVGLKALNSGIVEIGKSVLVAARIKALARVYEFTGKKAGFTADQLQNYRQQLIRSGIAEREALGVLQRGIQARFDLNKVVDLGRIAQNAAFVAGVNSSDAHRDLMDAIVKQRPILLKQFGILINLNRTYGEGAKKLGVKQDALSATQRREILYNEVVKQSVMIQGAYVEGMKEVGKRLTSLPRHYQAAQNALGQHFVPALGLGVDALEGFLKAVKNTFSTLQQEIAAVVQGKKAFDESSAATMKMADRYDELAAMTERDAYEQNELNVILRNFEKMSPDLITAWDSQGNAVSANTTKLRDNIEQQKLLNALQMKSKILEVRDAYNKNNKEVLAHVASLKKMQAFVPTVHMGMRQIKAGQNAINEKLMAGREINKGYVREMSIAFPALEEGTEQYALAVEYLEGNLLKAVLAHQALGRLAQGGFGEDSDAAVAGIDLSSIEAAERARAQIIKEIRDNNFENIKIGKTEHQQEMLDIQREYDGKVAELFMSSSLSMAEKVMAIDVVEQNRKAANHQAEVDFQDKRFTLIEATNNKIERINKKAQREYDKAVRERLRQWRFVTKSLQGLFGTLFKSVIFESDKLKENMKAAFKQIGQSIVQGLVNMGVNAIIKWIATSNLMKPVMLEKIALVNAEAKAWQKVAIAQAAATLGATTAKSIAAAGVTKAGLTTILGFDNPINDSFARKSGADFGQYFMSSLADTLSPPDFGRDVSGMLAPTFQAGVPQSSGGLTIHFNGNVMTDEFVHEVVIPEIQNAYHGGQTNVIADSGFVNGEPDVSI